MSILPTCMRYQEFGLQFPQYMICFLYQKYIILFSSSDVWVTINNKNNFFFVLQHPFNCREYYNTHTINSSILLKSEVAF